ncbi:hypothetical protein HHI36_010177 [Cryptolaemus montrouzieri]|uniref:Reverse transcriptase domain-containing protein n=1 Tax=Cryptolaemus montrouzieri TaxID=559131 RepID=A0ABD2MI11_9CUCU
MVVMNGMKLIYEFASLCVLGLLLFLLYCNDLERNLPIFHCAFADDITLVSSDEEQQNVVSALSANFEVINDYFASNDLRLNQEKTHSVQFEACAHKYNKSQLIKLNKKVNTK